MIKNIELSKLFLANQLSKNNLNLLNLRVGQIIKGEVVDILGNRALILLQGKKVLAEINASITKGEEYYFTIERLAEKIILKLSDESSQQSENNELLQDSSVDMPNNLVSQTLWQFPNVVDEKKYPVFLQITKEKEKDSESYEEDTFYLHFHFELPYLGELVIQLHIQEKKVKTDILSASVESQRVIKEFEPIFSDFLLNNGYQNSGINYYSLDQNREQNIFINKHTGLDLKI